MMAAIAVMLMCTVLSNAQSTGKKISIDCKNEPMTTVLKKIEKASGLKILFTYDEVQNYKVSVTMKNQPLDKVLQKVLANTPLKYSVRGKFVNITMSRQLRQTPRGKNNRVTGLVLDANGEPLIGVTVKIKGTSMGALTDINGKFDVAVDDDNATLMFSYIGKKNVERRAGSGDYMKIMLEDAINTLENVVVTGYQTISKERATGSFAIVTPKDMEGKLQTNILNRMEGMVAGLKVVPNSSGTAGTPEIRGISTLNGTRAPLYVVDGIPYEGSLSAINPSDIVNITVLKDATAASIYGARSANGVIVITTKMGQTGKMRVNYTGSVKFMPLPDRDYYNYTSSEETVNLMEELYGYYHNTYNSKDRRSTNEVYLLMYQRDAGEITADEYQKQMDVYRHNDRHDQVKDEFLRSANIVHQHNLSFNGGSDLYKYALSVNYQQNLPFEKVQSTDRFGFNLKNQFDLYKWLRVDVGIINSNVKEDYDNGFSGFGLLNGGQSYRMLRNADGSPAQWYNGKSQLEIDRLNKLGLQDETYIPLNEQKNAHYKYTSKYWNVNVNARIKLMDCLSLNLQYQTETTSTYNKQYYSKDAISVKSQINDATKIDKNTGVVTNLMPIGGQITERRGATDSYTMRAQLNFEKLFNDKHEVQIIAGAERRKVTSEDTYIKKVGYDDSSLSYKVINELDLGTTQRGTEAVYGSFSYQDSNPAFGSTDNRYISFYGNASYTFDDKLTLTGSIRVDQSNLFGTDPKYQYKPLWSLGAHYVALRNWQWIDRLAVRATYGINGNVAKGSGPYMISQSSTKGNYYTNEFYADITTPPNPTLRWEKTGVLNFGVDFNLLKGRIGGSVEFYNKKTVDLLGNRATDPTFGWSSLMLNYGSMYNRGIEISLQTTNIVTKDFKWMSNLVFSYNKNKLTKIENAGTSAYSYFGSYQNREGYAMNSIFAIRYAGLDKDGFAQAYKADGTIVNDYSKLEKEDLVYKGTINPPYSASLTNRFYYKGFDLDFMFVFYGGHKLRDVASGFQYTYYPVMNYTGAVDRDRLNFWRKAGDESDPNMAPRFLYRQSRSNATSSLWQYADKHIQKGDYIKLRDLSIGYTFPKVLIRKCYMENLRVSLQIQNLWYWAANDKNLDPEAWGGTTSRGTHYPATFTLGLSANF
jgi:TonB-linked SusC/RagA family outer membrane protein